MSYVPSGPFGVGVCDLAYRSKDGLNGDKTQITARSHLVGRLFYPCSPESSQGRRFSKASWLPSWIYARGYGEFLTAWGGTSWTKTLLKPMIVALSYSIGRQAMIDNYVHAPLADTADKLPLVIFSHGIGGTRNAYSGMCSELGSAGFVVLAVEHADGTAATVSLAGGAGHKFYAGWLSEEERLAQTRYRMEEISTAYGLLTAMHSGQATAGLSLSSGGDPAALLRGRIDFDRAALMGHSYGGATVTELTAQDGRFRAGVALDPWWGALPADGPALTGWQTTSPLLVMGSHTWNIPNQKGRLFCDGERQQQVFSASADRAGSVHLVLEGSGHDTFNDAVQLVALRYKTAMQYVRSFKQDKRIIELDATLALPLSSYACLVFLRRHLAVSQAQGESIDAALRANAERIAAAQQFLDEAAAGAAAAAAAAAAKKGMPADGQTAAAAKDGTPAGSQTAAAAEEETPADGQTAAAAATEGTPAVAQSEAREPGPAGVAGHDDESALNGLSTPGADSEAQSGGRAAPASQRQQDNARGDAGTHGMESMAAAAVLSLEREADEATASASNAEAYKVGSFSPGTGSGSPRDQAGGGEEADRELFLGACLGHIWKLDVYGFK